MTNCHGWLSLSIDRGHAWWEKYPSVMVVIDEICDSDSELEDICNVGNYVYMNIARNHDTGYMKEFLSPSCTVVHLSSTK